MISDQKRFQQAIQQFDQANSQDPNKELENGKEQPKELLYAQRMTGWLQRFEPEASEALQLAARSQHICRWTVPRNSYPMDRKGYLQWRSELKRFHADKAAEIMHKAGYDQALMDQVKSLILKKRMKTDPESQMLEDVVCLVFLDYYFPDFAEKHPPEKVVSIIQKTWNKMSDRGRETALNLSFSDGNKSLIEQAIG